MSGGSIIKPCESTVQVDKISSHRETWVPTLSVLKGKALFKNMASASCLSLATSNLIADFNQVSALLFKRS